MVLLQHQEAATVPDNNKLEARNDPPVWQAPPLEIPSVFFPSSHGGKPLFLNVPYPDNIHGVASIYSLMKSMETAMGDTEIRHAVSQFATALMETYKLKKLLNVGEDVMNPLSSLELEHLRDYIAVAVASHNEGHWLENTIPKDKGGSGGNSIISQILAFQDQRTPPQHGRTHAQSIPGLTFPPQSTLPWKKAGAIYIPPKFLPDNPAVTTMNVPEADNMDGYHSMIKLLGLLGSAGRKKHDIQLSYILQSLGNIYEFDHLSLDDLEFQSVKKADLPAFKKDQIEKSLGEHNGKFSD
ncbi:hypothetical protein H0H93_015882 [Arthromyces matolae]|nr:hypothetical protein H0H93_015882 [Arthromyces matolae]